MRSTRAMTLPLRDAFHHTYADYFSWNDEERYELINGIAYVKPFDVRLPKAGEADDLIDTVVQPDVLIVRDLSKLDDRGMRGAPDWIAEVLSPTTARHDEVIKIPVYERAGVLEVWLIHPVERALTVYRLRNGRYTRPIILELKGRTAITALPGVSIDWGRILRMLE